jgi:3'-5' exoribonuclease
MYSKRQRVISLREGDRVDDVFVVKIKKGILPYAKGFRLRLVLSDSSGASMPCTYWGGPDEEEARRLSDSIRADGVVHVKGSVQEFNGRLAISVNPPDSMTPLKEGEYDPDDFVGKPRRDPDAMEAELISYVEAVENPDIRRLLERLFVQDRAFLAKFKSHPGAIEIHHNWRGGLIQHTLEVVKYCEVSKRIFEGLDMDLMVAGALLHDVGKMEELEVTTRIKATERGQLKGHIALGYSLLSRVMDELGTPESLRNKLLHIMVSHHGRTEHGSPKEPMFPEALVVYYADELSSKLSHMADFVQFARTVTEDDFLYSNRLDRNVYLK